jgi:hypothetical protein
VQLRSTAASVAHEGGLQLTKTKGRERTTVDGTGRFTVSMGVTVTKGETYEVTATGEQTGTTVTETFDAF